MLKRLLYEHLKDPETTNPYVPLQWRFSVGSGVGDKPPQHTRFVCIGDTYNWMNSLRVPDGDVLVHTGGFTANGTREEVQNFTNYMYTLPHKYKIVLCGETETDYLRCCSWGLKNFIPLSGNYTIINGIRIFGASISDDNGISIKHGVGPVDMVISHIPPYGILDMDYRGLPRGNMFLNSLLAEMGPSVAVFGGCPVGHGALDLQNVLYANCSTYGFDIDVEKNIIPVQYGIPLVIDLPNRL